MLFVKRVEGDDITVVDTADGAEETVSKDILKKTSCGVLGYDCGRITPVMLDEVAEVIRDTNAKCFGLDDVYELNGEFNRSLGGKVLPDMIPYGIKKISSRAFFMCSELEEINFPATVEVIGGSAFFACVNLKALKLPRDLRIIEDSAFDGCTELESAEIPFGTLMICNGAFLDCPKLKSVTVPPSLEYNVGAYAFGYINAQTEEKVHGFTIRGCKGSAAERYAKANGFKFEELPYSAFRP